MLGGLREGLVARTTRLAGIVLGLVMLGRTVPVALALIDPPSLLLRGLVAITVAMATFGLVGVLVGAITAPFRALLRLGPLSILDRAAGAVASGIAAVLLVWLLIPAAASVPGRVSAEVRSSTLLTAVDAALPPQPDVTRSLRTLFGAAGFPDPLLGLAPTPAPSSPPPDLGALVELAPAVAAAQDAATWIRAVGCGRLQTGSGFALDADLIVTNAHVVAGGREVTIRGADGRVRDAVVLTVDPGRDLALLSAPGHGLRPLTTGPSAVGDLAVVVGFPGGSLEPRTAAARVDREVLGVGRDIYGADGAERALLFLAAELRSGDSGAPVVGADGTLIGVVFAVSPDVRTVAYAVAASEITSLLALPRSPGDTGRCI